MRGGAIMQETGKLAMLLSVPLFFISGVIAIANTEFANAKLTNITLVTFFSGVAFYGFGCYLIDSSRKVE